MSKQLKIQPNEKKKSGTGIKKLKDLPAFNSSFMTTKNIMWFHFVMTWQPAYDKPLIFLPCARANKTRGKDGDHRKFISQSMTHQFMSAITRDTTFSKVILSEPLSLIPYEIESHECRPDYNIPPEDLSIQSEWIFIHHVSLYLSTLKVKQPFRTFIYFIGSTHHYFILKFANELANNPFKLIYRIPENGIRGYASASKEFKEEILNLEENKVLPDLKPVDLDKHIKSRGRYTHRQFWNEIKTLKMEKKSIVKEGSISICGENEYENGFTDLYNFKAS